MMFKRKNTVAVYLFTASAFIAGLCRFAYYEKLADYERDDDRLKNVSVLAGDVYYYGREVTEESENFFAECSLPLEQGSRTSSFGFREDPFGKSEDSFHGGVDIAVPMNSEVYAIYEGEVLTVGYDDEGGNFVRILHPNGFVSYYGHLAQACITEGQRVSCGQFIALSGDSGKATGPHLHLGLYYKGQPVDPEVYLDLTKYT